MACWIAQSRVLQLFPGRHGSLELYGEGTPAPAIGDRSNSKRSMVDTASGAEAKVESIVTCQAKPPNKVGEGNGRRRKALKVQLLQSAKQIGPHRT